NPLTHPATININFDRALYWVETGASPSDTVRSILKREGVYLMKHLRGGIAKGAITENDANKKFLAWEQEKESKVSNTKREAADQTRTEGKKRLEAETKVRETIAKKVAAKYAVEAAKEAKAAEVAAEETATEEVVAEVAATEEVVTETATEEAVEAAAEIVADITEPEAEAPVAEETPITETLVAEEANETPVE
ncbi:MAG: 30S ribosomal protein S16, partial [Lentimicrobiaceae bacterium]|nr:30S ribosomal protein S16 [Lentimicrobiaceae bacterium]